MNWPLIIGVCADVIVAVGLPVVLILGLHWLLGCANHINALDADL